MLKFVTTGQEGPVLGIGLSALNWNKIRAGQPIIVELGEMGWSLRAVPQGTDAAGKILVMGGETEADIAKAVGLPAKQMRPGQREGAHRNRMTGHMHVEREEDEPSIHVERVCGGDSGYARRGHFIPCLQPGAWVYRESDTDPAILCEEHAALFKRIRPSFDKPVTEGGYGARRIRARP